MEGLSGPKPRGERERAADARRAWEAARRARFAEIGEPPDEAGGDGGAPDEGAADGSGGGSGGGPGGGSGRAPRAGQDEPDRRRDWDADGPTESIPPSEWQERPDRPTAGGATGLGPRAAPDPADRRTVDPGQPADRDRAGRERADRGQTHPDRTEGRHEDDQRHDTSGPAERRQDQQGRDEHGQNKHGQDEPDEAGQNGLDGDPYDGVDDPSPFDWLKTPPDPADSGRWEPGHGAPGGTDPDPPDQRPDHEGLDHEGPADQGEPAWGGAYQAAARDEQGRGREEDGQAGDRTGDESGGDGGEPPLPTEPGGCGLLDRGLPDDAEMDPLTQSVWADEPSRPSWARTRSRAPAGAAASRDPRGRAGATRAGTGAAGAGTQRPPAGGQRGRPGVGWPNRRRVVGGRAGGRRARGPVSPEARRRRRRVRADILAPLIYVLGAVYVLERLLPDPGGRVQTNVPDQTFFQWVLAYGGRVVAARENPLFTTRLGAPVGVNLIANTSVLGISLPLSPVTLLFGSAVSYVVFSILALALTASAWYYVLSRHVVRSRLAAGVGGGLAGFGPAMISHSYGHPNIVAQFLVPFIVWRTIRLRERRRALRGGIVLGLLVTWQAFINEEVLLIAAIGMLIFVLSYAAMRPSVVPRDALPFLRGLGVTIVVSGALLAYPLWVEFRGPQHGNGANTAGPRPYPADVLSFPGFSSTSLAGSPAVVGRLAQNISEQNAFFGWPLLILLAAMTWFMRRSRVYLSGCVVALVLTALSLGSRVTVGGRPTTFSGPWDLVAHLPLFRQVVPTRVAVDIAPVLAVLLALAYDRVAAVHARDPLGPGNLVWHGALIAVLVPLVPVPLHVSDLPPVPQFITAGVWHEYVDDDHSLVGVPSAALGRLEPMRWSAITNAGFAIPAGYYLAPNGAFGPTPRATTTLLDGVAISGRIPDIGPREQTDALTDLRYWKASVVVVVPGFHTDQVNETGTELFGFQPRYVSGVWVWDVRQLVATGVFGP